MNYYKRLRKINLLRLHVILALMTFYNQLFSERFLRVCNRQVQTRPIKGTRPRGKNALEDEEMKQALLSSQKDNAELP
ncbi:chorismate-binding protein [Candidatus Kuenenia stuttgartiensis]|uniref:chorismate-binding protein n=1 Tax=Kuenenia stuttgartiensis TaxID=174633 RepID=UPI000C071E0A|nr:chorismate-binding protein [Candidatus Kuenenia stuttgartiensis]